MLHLVDGSRYIHIHASPTVRSRASLEIHLSFKVPATLLTILRKSLYILRFLHMPPKR